ncbi:aminopeptidase P family protein [Mycoplasmopsis felifaucium]|uniref:Aminopeptidase P family protein n=1 Tax=Mycoplasmopsis felifaucium TaxID=35768 RepID=A0ABZ2RS87_9BACT
MNTKRLNNLFKNNKVDALVSNTPQTRLWFSGVQTTDGIIIIEKNKAYLFVDGRYIEYCEKNAKHVEVRLLTGTSLKEFFAEKSYETVAFEKDYLIYEEFTSLMNFIKPKRVGWLKGQELRLQKCAEEKACLQKAVDISLAAYDELMQWVKPGMTEKEVAAYLNYLLKKHGADKEAFDEIVATGANAAEPHHHPTDAKLELGDVLKVDFGALYKGYCADITRTCILGGETKAKSDEMLKIINIVNQAAKLGRDAVKPGIKASVIDKICRDYIEAQGYGKYFVHSTGHGLGIDVHELPRVSKISDYTLEPGMVITVEPGIYVPGLGGARTEDDVMVTDKSRYIFSRPNE